MVKVIIGTKGTGKTKKLIEMVNTAVAADKGQIVCLEYGDVLKFDIPSQVRLINVQDYSIKGFDALEGFIKGILASNYDISDIFVDGVLKITGDDLNKLGEILENINAVSQDANVVLLVSADPETAGNAITKFTV